ncbi:DNA transformation protein [Oryzomicrobium terrae]|uniref:DNA transformation protein n=1 Tax=Oryzomicrobium terrae TaxID=1735038 RepID=A0A5C1EB28_9RHOO|nr:TfoX/Sxy family protein [Oryzomicrobium terrae]QEL66103.1 DNA transformation protein [Oryzomicrobium terrae]
MPDDDLTWLLDRLAPLGRVSARRMFGSRGLYCDGVFFAIYSDGQLYLKADDGNRDDFTRLGLTPLTFQAPSGRVQVLPYYPLPDEAADDDGALWRWCRSAIAAGLRRGRPTPGQRGRHRTATADPT